MSHEDLQVEKLCLTFGHRRPCSKVFFILEIAKYTLLSFILCVCSAIGNNRKISGENWLDFRDVLYRSSSLFINDCPALVDTEFPIRVNNHNICWLPIEILVSRIRNLSNITDRENWRPKCETIKVWSDLPETQILPRLAV